jgi:hypothetical protein
VADKPVVVHATNTNAVIKVKAIICPYIKNVFVCYYIVNYFILHIKDVQDVQDTQSVPHVQTVPDVQNVQQSVPDVHDKQ